MEGSTRWEDNLDLRVFRHTMGFYKPQICVFSELWKEILSVQMLYYALRSALFLV
jgi:hypothetical protein